MIDSTPLPIYRRLSAIHAGRQYRLTEKKMPREPLGAADSDWSVTTSKQMRGRAQVRASQQAVGNVWGREANGCSSYRALRRAQRVERWGEDGQKRRAPPRKLWPEVRITCAEPPSTVIIFLKASSPQTRQFSFPRNSIPTSLSSILNLF